MHIVNLVILNELKNIKYYVKYLEKYNRNLFDIGDLFFQADKYICTRPHHQRMCCQTHMAATSTH